MFENVKVVVINQEDATDEAVVVECRRIMDMALYQLSLVEELATVSKYNIYRVFMIHAVKLWHTVLRAKVENKTKSNCMKLFSHRMEWK